MIKKQGHRHKMVRKIIYSGILVSSILLANNSVETNKQNNRKQTNINTKKEKIIKRVSKRIQTMKKFRDCISEANNQQAIGACKRSMKQLRKSKKRRKHRKNPQR